MPSCTSGGLIKILDLPELFILNICMFSLVI
jgi:hypothetical protein